ncbi:MAG: DUF6599 family protein [bacterium]
MSYRLLSLVLIAIAMGLIIAACGGEPAEQETSPVAGFFPAKLAAVDLERNSSIDTHIGDSLYSYIDGGAELYHEYGFELVSTASYALAETDIILDVYQFADAVGAYGLYSRLRPDWPESANLGIESFASPTSIDFVKGKYLVRLTTFEASEALAVAMQKLGQSVEQGLQGTVELPPLFSRFPDRVVIPSSRQYYAIDYLGHDFLDEVYACAYSWGEKEFTLFLTEDANGQKLAKFGVLPGIEKTDASPFPGGESLVLNDDYYGQIIAARVGDYLVGIINFSTGLEQLIAEWGDSLSH